MSFYSNKTQRKFSWGKQINFYNNESQFKHLKMELITA